MRHFVAVAEELHFGRGAARLGMAQPPLSQSIRRLEEALGFPLFERTQRKVALTPAGRVFLDEARRTLMQADEAVRLARRAASDDLAQLSVTFVSAALYRVLPEVLRRYRTAWPEAEIRLDERPTDLQIADLRSGTVDAGFVHPPLRDAADLEVEIVHSDHLVVALPEANALARSDWVTLADLQDESFVLFPHQQGPALHSRIMQACRRAGFLPRVTQEARQMHTLLTLVAAGMGVSLVPAGAQTMPLEGVAFRPLHGLPGDLAWDLAVAWRRKGTTLALSRFLAMTREVAAEYAAQ
jgi:DNA-binding transcriptional LysR family regulator